MLSIISAFLSNCKLKVVLEVQSSPATRSINSGAPRDQYLVLLILFVYINDLPDEVFSQITKFSILYCVSLNSFNTYCFEVSVSLNNKLKSMQKVGRIG